MPSTAEVMVAEAATQPDGTIGLEAMLAAIRDAYPSSLTPPSLREACLAFITGDHGKSQVDHLRVAMLVTLGIWVIEGERNGYDRHMLEQIAAAETHKCIGVMMRGAKERRGEPFIPARMSIVAFQMADNVAKADPFKCDMDAAVAAYETAMTEDVTDTVDEPDDATRRFLARWRRETEDLQRLYPGDASLARTLDVIAAREREIGGQR